MIEPTLATGSLDPYSMRKTTRKNLSRSFDGHVFHIQHIYSMQDPLCRCSAYPNYRLSVWNYFLPDEWYILVHARSYWGAACTATFKS